MEFDNTFEVPLPPEQAWPVLMDIQRIAPCMPGATLESVDGDEFTGSVKVKLGPINLTYKGKAHFVEKDEAAHRAVIDARGKDARGAGTASALITATLAAAGERSTTVDVRTDLDITGKPAQFGRGVMADVGNKIIGQFASSLADEIGASNGSPATDDTATSSAASPRHAAPQPEVEPIDLMANAGPAIAKRLAPLALVLLLLIVRRRRRKRAHA